MKKLNESRIQNTANYIKEYFSLYGECPTYRDIKDKFNYSSLSLVSSDIKKLKEHGFLVDNEFKHIKLASQKEEHIVRYNYPFLIMTDALEHIDLLSEEERKLLQAQDLYLKADIESSQRLCKELLDSSDNKDIFFGAKLTLCWTSVFTGEVNYWKDFFRLLISYQTQSLSEKMEKEMISHFLISILKNSDNCPDWLVEGRFYDLRREAYPLANLLYFSKVINSEEHVSPHYLEPLCSVAALHHIDIIQVYMDLYLAMLYRYSENEEYLNAHLEGAIKTCLKHRWFIPLIEVRKSLGSVLCPLLEEYEPGIVAQIDKMVPDMVSGYTKLYETIVGENTTKNLTFREVEIVNYVRMGHTNKEIADKLYLSPETVKYYLSSIYLKLGIENRSELKELIRKTYKL